MKIDLKKALLNHAAHPQHNGLIKKLGFLLLFSYLAMWLWNNIFPAVLDLTVISYWHTLGFLFLASFFSDRLRIFGNKSHPTKHKTQGN